MTLESGIRSFDAKAEARRFALFVALGGCAAAANWLSRFPLEHFMSFSAAVVVAYMVGMVIAFTLFNRYVFPASPRPLAEQIKFFVLVNHRRNHPSLGRVHGSGLSCVSRHWLRRTVRRAHCPWPRHRRSDHFQLFWTQVSNIQRRLTRIIRCRLRTKTKKGNK